MYFRLEACTWKITCFSFGIYYTIMKSIETNIVIHEKCFDLKIFMLWHDRFGYLGSIMMQWIVENSHKHPLKNLKILFPSENPCIACSQGKLITKLSPWKVIIESPYFLERILLDIL